MYLDISVCYAEYWVVSVQWKRLEGAEGAVLQSI